MSPIGIGDIIAVYDKLSDCYTAFKDAPDAFNNLKSGLDTYKIVLAEFSRLLQSRTSVINERQAEIQAIHHASVNVVDRGDSLLTKYKPADGVWKRIVAATVINDIRPLLDLMTMNEAGISAFNTSLVVVSQDEVVIPVMKRIELMVASLVSIFNERKGGGKAKNLQTDRREVDEFLKSGGISEDILTTHTRLIDSYLNQAANPDDSETPVPVANTTAGPQSDKLKVTQSREGRRKTVSILLYDPDQSHVGVMFQCYLRRIIDSNYKENFYDVISTVDVSTRWLKATKPGDSELAHAMWKRGQISWRRSLYRRTVPEDPWTYDIILCKRDMPLLFHESRWKAHQVGIPSSCQGKPFARTILLDEWSQAVKGWNQKYSLPIPTGRLARLHNKQKAFEQAKNEVEFAVKRFVEDILELTPKE